jgi:hypothetical protein
MGTQMLKFLLSPAFNFTQDILGRLVTAAEVESPYGRIMVYPVANGLRLRNLADTKQLRLEVQGSMVYSEYTVLDPDETEDDRELRGPLKITNSVADAAIIVEKLTDFFEGKWSIK